MNSRQYRIRADIYERLQSAASRYNLAMSEICRRACRSSNRAGVYDSLDDHLCTREAPAVNVAGLPEGVRSPQLSAVLEWYLTEKDTGGRAPISMAGAMLVATDGVITYTGPIPKSGKL